MSMMPCAWRCDGGTWSAVSGALDHVELGGRRAPDHQCIRMTIVARQGPAGSSSRTVVRAAMLARRDPGACGLPTDVGCMRSAEDAVLPGEHASVCWPCRQAWLSPGRRFKVAGWQVSDRFTGIDGAGLATPGFSRKAEDAAGPADPEDGFRVIADGHGRWLSSRQDLEGRTSGSRRSSGSLSGCRRKHPCSRMIPPSGMQRWTGASSLIEMVITLSVRQV